MKLLLRQVRIIDPSSPFHQQRADLLIQNGIITDIGTIQDPADKIIEEKDLCVSPGWMDVFAHFNDPGYEFKETLESGAAAAAAGGFTDVMLIPNTLPVVHNKSSVEYLVQRSRLLPVNLHPIGAVTRNAEGKELSEMYDMRQSGALAFSDGHCSIQSAGLLLKALQYVKAIKATIIQVPDDRSISGAGLMNEGVASTRLGLPGKPSIAEELMISRDIELAAYTESRIHFTGFSSAASVELIKKAKAAGVQVTCSVSPAHLFFCDEDLAQYDTNLKLNPPLRTKEDRSALLQAVKDGVIDCIASHHFPQDTDHKDVEFEYAGYGIAGIETAFAVVNTAMKEIDAARIAELFSAHPRSVFGLPVQKIEKDAPASLTLFSTTTEWTPYALRSRSRNSPFLHQTLRGKVFGIINKDKLFLNE